MKLFLLFLHRQDLIDEALEALVEMEITDATVFDGTAMERILADEVPIFAGLWQSHGDDPGQTRLIVAAVRTDILTGLAQVLEEVGVDLADPEIARAFVLPVDPFPGP